MGSTSYTHFGSHPTPAVSSREMTHLLKGDGLIHSPKILVAEPSIFRIMGCKADPNRKPWGFWIGGSFLAFAAFHVYHVGANVRWSIQEIVIGIAFLVVGLLFLKYGVTSNAKEIEVALVDANKGTLIVHSSSNTSQYSLAEIEEVVFGMVQFPVEEGKSINVHAFTLLVRIGDLMIPIVEASPDKGELFAVTKLMSEISGAPIIQVGDGIR